MTVPDLSAQIDMKAPLPFSSHLERYLPSTLSVMGFDTGQIVHSVLTDACDAASALWWMLKKKAERNQVLEAKKEAERKKAAGALEDRSGANAREKARAYTSTKGKVAKEAAPGYRQVDYVRLNVKDIVHPIPDPEAAKMMAPFKTRVSKPILVYHQDRLPSARLSTGPLLVLNRPLHKDAVKCFKVVQKVIGERVRKKLVAVKDTGSLSTALVAAGKDTRFA
ncbi:hypothetical protein FRB90_003185 [Tulasnella sp. 427]|nr:hypothetical protein FRB90_003185 [Tulasnella sp. 427]